MKLTKRVLRNKAKPVDFRYSVQNQSLARSMIQFMRSEKGIGLSATQVGIAKRVFVMEINDRTWACFNPEIVSSSQEFAEIEEGCLSFPGESCIVSRPCSITVRYQAADGSPVEETLRDLEARCFQHELDHLDGITMHDRYKEQYATKSGN
jgi:peptide deformylase